MNFGGTSAFVANLFLLLLFSDPISAQNFVNDAATTLTVGSFNDSFNGGFALNRDDHMSFGFDAGVNHKDLIIGDALFKGMTNRSAHDTSLAGRLDELSFTCKYALYANKLITIYPQLGLVFSGNLGGSEIQNGMHENVGEPTVDVPYDYEDVVTSFLFGLYAHQRFRLSSKSDLVHLKNELYLSHATDYANHLSIGTNLIVGTELENSFRFTLAYQIWDAYKSTTTAAVYDQFTGLKLGFEQDVSFLVIGYEYYPNTHYGIGRIGVNLMKSGQHKTYDSYDVSIDFRALLDRGGYGYHIHWDLFEVRDHPIMMSLGHIYGTYPNGFLNNQGDAYAQHTQFNIGAQSYLFRLKEGLQWNPYLGTGTGVKFESSYAGDDLSIETQTSYSFLGYVDLGFRFGGMIKAISRNTVLGISMGSMYSFPFQSDEQVIGDQVISVLEPQFNPYVGLNFILDL